MDTEPYDGRLGLARERCHAFFGDGMSEPFGQLRARAPRRRRFLAQPEHDRQTRLGRNPCRASQVLLQPRAGKEPHDFHDIMPRAEPERAALPLRQPDIGPRQVVVNDPLHPGQIEPFGRDIGSEQDVRSREHRWRRRPVPEPAQNILSLHAVVADSCSRSGAPRHGRAHEPALELSDCRTGRAEDDGTAPVSVQELREPGGPGIPPLEPDIGERHHGIQWLEVVQGELPGVSPIVVESPHHELIGHGAHGAAKRGSIQDSAGRLGIGGMPQQAPIPTQCCAERRGTRCQRRKQRDANQRGNGGIARERKAGDGVECAALFEVGRSAQRHRGARGPVAGAILAGEHQA